jgi:hypothetical protein
VVKHLLNKHETLHSSSSATKNKNKNNNKKTPKLSEQIDLRREKISLNINDNLTGIQKVFISLKQGDRCTFIYMKYSVNVGGLKYLY